MASFVPRTGLGLELLDDEIRLASVRRSFGRISVAAAVSKPLPAGLVVDGEVRDSSAVVRHLEAALAECRPASRRVVLAVPDSRVFCRVMTVPPVRGQKLDRLVDYEVQNNKVVPFPDPVYDFAGFPGPSRPKSRKVLLAATSARVVDGLTGVVGAAGLRPYALELGPLALMRMLRRLGVRPPEQGLLVIQARANWLGMHFFQGECLVHTRHSRIATAEAEPAWGAEAAETDTAALSRSGLDAMVSEIEQALRFYAYSLNEREHPIEMVWWVGASDQLAEHGEWLARTLGLPVRVLPEGQGAWGLDAPSLATYAVAVGLALKGVD